MYQFVKVQDDNDGWRFELNGINLLLDGFSIKDGQHWIKNPSKAIGFFKLNGYLYGISNDLITCRTAEDFFDNMMHHYHICKEGKEPVAEAINNIPVSITANHVSK
jgi:hypothetical protein